MITYTSFPEFLRADYKEEAMDIWLRSCAEEYDKRIIDLQYHFVGDAEILSVNNEFLKHNYVTDIITFDYCIGKRIKGEIFIGVDQVCRQAGDFGSSEKDELCRVIVHGLLHLIGYDDHSDEEKKEMRQEEDKCLILRSKIKTK